MAMAEATQATFAELALGGLTLVDFYTADCVPCRRLEPMLAALGRSAGDGLRLVRVDAAVWPALAERLGVQGVPTLVLLRHGREMSRRTGFPTAPPLQQRVRPHLEEGMWDRPARPKSA